MALKFAIVGSKEAAEAMRDRAPRIVASVNRALLALGYKLQAHIQQDKLHGQVLKQRTGRLAGSIHVTPHLGDTQSYVQVGTNVEYARIHEYGGTTKAHIITARNKKALAFISGGADVIVRSVRHPGSKMPERSFLRSALRDMTPEIKQRLAAAVREGTRPA